MQPPIVICNIADYGSGPVHHRGEALAERIMPMKLKCHLFGHENLPYEHKFID